jgi:hypothetical protein
MHELPRYSAAMVGDAVSRHWRVLTAPLGRALGAAMRAATHETSSEPMRRIRLLPREGLRCFRCAASHS